MRGCRGLVVCGGEEEVQSFEKVRQLPGRCRMAETVTEKLDGVVVCVVVCVVVSVQHTLLSTAFSCKL